MCQMKSGIILKDRVFIPDYNSHTDMLAELGISDTRQNAERLFIRAELLPPDGDVFAPVEEWRFHVDQDILPDWYVEQVDKDRMISAVKEWAKDHIHVGVDGLRISQGSEHYIKDCKNVVVCGNASISRVCGNASISRVCGNASISEVYGNASISYVYDNASISYVYDNASISCVYGNASISKVYGSASISCVYGGASISEVYDNASISEVYDNASISEVYGSASISYVYGSASISYVCGNASISEVYGNASISYVYGSASISEICGNASISEVKGQAFIANSPYTRWIKQDGLTISENATFKDNMAKTIWQAGDWELKKVGE